MAIDNVTGSQILAARALVGVSRSKLAARAGVTVPWLEAVEASGWVPIETNEALDRLRAALEEFGAIFIDEAEGSGGGVRVKFSRAQARAIGRWEGEGGAPADDDIP